MDQSLWVSKTGLDAQQTAMNMISNNLANSNTTAFKSGRAAFQSLMYQTIRQPGAQSSQNTQLPGGLMFGTGVQTIATEQNFTQGSVVQTGNQLDTMINGRGFFPISMPDGTIAYTRDGHFQLNSSGQIVTASGYTVQPGFTVPQGTTSITISSDGLVSAVTASSTTPVQLGTIELTDFANTGGLQPIGQNLYRETAASGSAQTGAPGSTSFGTLTQGNLEGSNVNTVEELVNLIQVQRLYEMNSKAISAVDGMLQYVNQHL